MKRLALAALAVLALSALPASAGKPQVVPPFNFLEGQLNNNPKSPSWCLNEDDFEWRHWYGSLSGEFSFVSDFCDLSATDEGWGGGGMGLAVDAKLTGRLDELSLSGPDGIYTPAFHRDAEFVGSKVVGKGRNAYVENEYSACVFIYDYDISVLTVPVAMMLRGDFSQADVTLTAAMYPYGLLSTSRCPPWPRD